MEPLFVDKDRLSRVKSLLPKIEKAYQEYAEKNYFPGYAFGVMVDGKLIHSGSAGDNFFLDNPLDVLRKETMKYFEKAGKIIQVEEIIAQNQLSGYFIMKGEQSSLKISFSLTPHFLALIQTFTIEENE
ncbi:MAG: hypothetical protein ACD_60C00060G0026 [uncultured bacterium]|nr:MAG: hypothetical protein ACD_60C00060G0026 [uncultured bacterium]